MNEIITRQALAVPGRSRKLSVTGKLRTAIMAMVWEGSRRDDAAKAAGLQPHSLREALRKAHVKRFYLDQIGALRSSELAKNIHALVDVRDNSKNAMSRVAAVKALDYAPDEEQTACLIRPSAGITIVIQQPSAAPSSAGLTIETAANTGLPARSHIPGKQMGNIARLSAPRAAIDEDDE